MHTAHGNTRRAVLIAGVTLLVIGVVGVVVFRTMGPGAGGLQHAADRLEDWIASQIVGVANNALVPQLAYEDIDYTAPGTVHLKGVTLTALDSEQGGGTTVLELEGMTVTLTEIPRIGEPIRISRLVLESPTVRLIREVNADGGVGFRGLNPIVRTKPGDEDMVESNFRLSSVLRLEQIKITDGAFFLDMGDGSPPMTIAGLTTTIESSPDADSPGWYALDIETSLGPLLDLSLTGALNLDTFLARIDGLRFVGQLDEESATVLPSQLQTLLAAHNAAGHVEITASGTLPLTDPIAGDIRFDATLTGFDLASTAYRLPISRLGAAGTLTGGVVSVPALVGEMLQGRLSASLRASLGELSMPASATWQIEGFDLADLLRVGSGGGSGDDTQTAGGLAGTLQGRGSVSTTLADPRSGLAGAGEVHIRDGRLLVLPGLTQLASVMNVAVRQNAEPEHQADATFTLSPMGIEITSSEVSTEFLAARATGTIGFDSSLDLSVNAGPMEKLQSMLGGLGEILGNMTDRLMKYRIRGTTADPQVTIAPLGIGG
ncbi:MAG: hypothetical protein Q9O74_07955 [Planctomycetota bacterium]|nr:hypothetical protein [Planctomycetota bacterium]